MMLNSVGGIIPSASKEKDEANVKEELKEKAAPIISIMEKPDRLTPTLVEHLPLMETPMPTINDVEAKEDSATIHFELSTESTDNYQKEKILSKSTSENSSNITVDKMFVAENTDGINSLQQPKTLSPSLKQDFTKDSTSTTSPLPAAAGGYLARPSNIYAETKAEVSTSKPSAEEPVPSQNIASKEEEELLDLQMQIVERDDIPAADVPLAYQALPPLTVAAEDLALRDEAEEQKRRAAERLQKLRNLSFNVNAADPNNEFETVPAYIRRNMELYNSNSQVENFYSNYEVKTDQNNQTQISTINTFLDGKKPD